jgi:hypothetical protein
MLKRFKSGDSGLIPVVIGLICMVLYFYIKNHVFLEVVNINNLFIQATILSSWVWGRFGYCSSAKSIYRSDT